MIACLVALIGLSSCALNLPEETARTVRAFELSDAAGKKHTAKEWAGTKAVVCFFISHECPASNGYAPELTRMFEEFRDKGVLFYGVHSDPDLTAQQAVSHAKEHRLSFPVLLDPTQSLAGQAGVKRVPTAIILSPEGKVLYRGRIDDRYISLGKKRAEPTQHDTRDALALVLAGKPPGVAETEVFGCLLPKLTVSPKQ